MESFQFTEFSANETSFDLEVEDSNDLDDNTETKSTPDFNENIELPLPPGISGDELFESLGYKPEAFKTSKIVQPISNEVKSKSDSLEASFSTFSPQLPSSFKIISENQKPDKNESDSIVNSSSKISEYLGDNRYSPSKVDSDEENQDVTSKPKVLGKEQAKKRLMAFSIAKQSTNATKKQNKTAPTKSKEKPPNPNKGTNFQEQFRATISAIEEEKKKIYQNMPDYLLQEMQELVKGHIVSSPNLKSSDKKNTDSKRKDKYYRHDKSSNKLNEHRRSSRRSLSRSSSRTRKRGRRSRSRSIGIHNKSRRRSWSRSRRYRSPEKKSREEKPSKTEQAKNEKDCIPKREVHEDWKSFKDSAAGMESDSVVVKNECHGSEGQEMELHNTSQDFRSHYKPIFDYLKKCCHKMVPFRAKVANHKYGKPSVFAEKTIKFTRTKPTVIWTENPSLATDYYMPKEVLLENCPPGAEPILRFVIEGKNSELSTDDLEIIPPTSHNWFPREKYLGAISPCLSEKTESPVDTSILENQSHEDDTQNSKIKISLVNEDYLSDEAEAEAEAKEKEITVDGVKVQLDLDMNSVKVRSKWDSDFEEGNNEKESAVRNIKSNEIPCGDESKKLEEKLLDFDVEPLHGSSEEKPQLLSESPGDRNADSHPGYLASEYEEFLKMVSFDSKDSQSEKINQYDIVTHEKTKKIEKPDLESDQNMKFSIDWDRESEQEEGLKISTEKFEITEKIFKAEIMKKKKNKMEKPKPKKKKIIKKLNKVKKDTNKDSCSEGSSSSESESDSDSDSDTYRSSKKKKKGKKSYSKRKKFLKEKKKLKKYCSDKSESDSDSGRPKKKKTKRKEESSESDESENKLLKQIDLKKKLIMKKVEEIDTVMEKIDRKKLKENEPGKECSEKDGSLKADKKKIKGIKKNKLKRIRKIETDSDSISSEDSVKKKKEMKKNRFSSESSDDSEEETKPSKTKSNKNKKAKKEKKKKWKKDSSSSESDESLVSKKLKQKEDLNPGKDFNSSLLLKETELKMEERLTEKNRKMLKRKEKKSKKEDDDWDTSSSSAESEEECEGSWDEEVKEAIKVPEIDTLQQREVEAVVPEKDGSEKNLVGGENLDPGTETLKNSLSNFSFNENSFCGFGQELSRDFFLTERSFSSSANIGTCENAGPTPIEARPFQCIGKGGEKKTVDSELYSPGCSDSEVSDSEPKCQNARTGSPAKEVYDPLNCESEGSADNNDVEIGTIPLPAGADVSLPEEVKPRNFGMPQNSPFLKINSEAEKTSPSKTPPLKFIANEFNLIPSVPLNENSPKKQIMNFKNQQLLKTKAASVFQDDSDEENKEPEKSNEKEEYKKTDKEIEEKKNLKKEPRDAGKERDRKRSQSRERKEKKSPSETTEASKREIRSDSFEIEPLKSISDEVIESVQPIPVLLGVSCNRVWSGSLPGYEFPQVSDNLIDQAESFDIYPSEESKYAKEGYACALSVEKPVGKSNKRRKSRSRSLSPKAKRKSKSPIRRRSPKRWSVSPKHRDKSPRSPRRRSPKRKSPSRRRSRSPGRRKKSRRLSSPRHSRSKSPLKRRSPKRWASPPRRKDSPSRGYSPRKDSHYPTYSDHSYWVPTVGHPEKVKNTEVNPSEGCNPQYDNLMPFPRMPAASINEAEMSNSFYEGEYVNEYGVNNYREEIGMNNLITVKNHSVEKVESPKRPSLDQRIELELGSPISSNSLQFAGTSQPSQTFEGADLNQYQTYSCDNTGANENFYQNQSIPDYNGQYFNEVQPSNYGSYPYPHAHPQPPTVQNTVMQVGNIVEVVPTHQHSLLPPPPPCQSKTPQIMQVGNVLQVVPTQKLTAPVPVPPPVLDHDSLPSSPVVKTQKATAVVAPSSVVPPPNLEAMINPLIKAILVEREKRNKAKEKRRLEREARRKARQLRREAKLMSVSEKLKKSVQNEGLVLGQEVEDDELLDAMDIPSPPVPVQIITVSSPSGVSPAGKGILITAGFVSKSPSKKKEVKFADGVYPGEGTSSSGEEDIPLSPPKPKLPKEKPFKKKKIKVKKKVKVHIIKQILHEEEDDDDDDNLSPPPPPPGDPPPVFFARFPFAGNAQFPVYQTQTTTATVQYPAQAI